MKFIQNIKLVIMVLFLSAVIISCTNEDKSTTLVNTAIDVPLANKNPFSFYKAIEIKPGLNFEVLSWGKGVDTLGGYLLLMSDSIKNNYKSINLERNGIIEDTWNMDLDNDGNPEIYVQFLIRKNFHDLNVYEFANNSFEKISFPGLNNLKGYVGNDKFFVKNGELFREVPIFTVDNGKTTKIVKTLQYNLRGNSFSSTAIKQKD